MSGFYYNIRLTEFQLTQSQLTKIRNYVREQVRDVAAIDSGEFLRSLKTQWDKNTQTLTIYSDLYYAGFIEGGNVNYNYHKDKVRRALIRMGLKTSSIQYL